MGRWVSVGGKGKMLVGRGVRGVGGMKKDNSPFSLYWRAPSTLWSP